MVATVLASVACPACGAHYPWRPDVAGRKMPCLRCPSIMRLPVSPTGRAHWVRIDARPLAERKSSKASRRAAANARRRRLATNPPARRQPLVPAPRPGDARSANAATMLDFEEMIGLERDLLGPRPVPPRPGSRETPPTPTAAAPPAPPAPPATPRIEPYATAPPAPPAPPEAPEAPAPRASRSLPATPAPAKATAARRDPLVPLSSLSPEAQAFTLDDEPPAAQPKDAAEPPGAPEPAGPYELSRGYHYRRNACPPEPGARERPWHVRLRRAASITCPVCGKRMRVRHRAAQVVIVTAGIILRAAGAVLRFTGRKTWALTRATWRLSREQNKQERHRLWWM